MTVFVSRLAAGVGWLAHGIGRLLGSVVWFAPRGVPWALLVVAVLAIGAWRSVEDARATTATQPRPEPVGLADVVDLGATGWVGTSSIVLGPFLDSATYGASVQRWYYLLIDPGDDGVAMVARSTERLEERRTRTIVARVEDDPDAVRQALDGLEAGTLAVDPDRYLVELDDRRPPVLTGDRVATPDGTGLEGEVILRGSFGVGRVAAGGEGFEYLVDDGNRALVVRSPYPPDSLPVDVWGVATTDQLRTEQAAAVPELQEALAGRELPQRRLLAEGVTPPLPEISYLPAMLMATLATVILLGWLIGYPLFRRQRLPDRIATWPMRFGDELPADLFGTDRRTARHVVVDGSPGTLALLPAGEVERRSWQFALDDAGDLGTAAAGDPPREASVLTLSSGEGPVLVRLDSQETGIRLMSGTVVRVGGARPGLRLRAPGLDLLAAFASNADRDRAAAAIDPSRAGAALGDPPPRRDVERRVSAPTARLPGPLRIAVAVLGAVAALFLVGGSIGVAGAGAGGSGLVPSIGQIAVAVGFAAVARGVLLRRGWAQGVGFTVAWIGALIAAFLIVAAPDCGLWLTPNLVACQAIGPLGSAGALVAAIGLGYAALAIRRHASSFVR